MYGEGPGVYHKSLESWATEEARPLRQGRDNYSMCATRGQTGNESKAELIRRFMRALRERPIAGDVYTQATSVEEEVNGLIDTETGAILVPDGVLKSPE